MPKFIHMLSMAEVKFNGEQVLSCKAHGVLQFLSFNESTEINQVQNLL